MIKITAGKEAQDKIIAGIDLAVNIVKQTMGAEGRVVVIEHPQRFFPIVTKDGKTVVEALQSDDRYEQLGIDLVKQVAQQTVQEAGDGTSTSCLLTQAIIHWGKEEIKKGTPLTQVKKRIQSVVDNVKEEIKVLSTPITCKDTKEISNIASVSANNNREIGNLLASAFEKIGQNGFIDLQTGDEETVMEFQEGMRVEAGLFHPYFCTNTERKYAELHNCNVLVVEGTLQDIKDVMPAMQLCTAENSLLIISSEISDSLLEVLVSNKVERGLKITYVKAPFYDDRHITGLQDICSFTGAKLLTTKTGLNIKPDDLGHVEKALVFQKELNLLGGNSETLKAAVETLSEMEEYERLANLTNNVATIKIGGRTVVERNETKDLVEDAYHAVRSAMEEGYVSGAGTTLSFIASKNKLPDFLNAPSNQILANADIENVETSEYGMGINVLTRTKENLLESGIIDSAKSVRASLENAASVAILALSTGGAVIN